MSETFCCMSCRLLQAPATACAECESPMIAAIENARPMLRYRNLEIAVGQPHTRRGKLQTFGYLVAPTLVQAGFLTAMALWWAAIPIAAGVGVGVGATAATVAWIRRVGGIASVPLLPVRTAEDAVTRRGIARRLSETIPSIAGRAPVLAEELVVRGRGGILFRRTRAAPFLVEEDGGARLVVDGVLRLGAPPVKQPKLERDDPRLEELGIPAAVRVPGKLEAAAVRDGDRVSITGVPATEIVRELAFHRDAGEATVMRGRASAVVLVGPGAA